MVFKGSIRLDSLKLSPELCSDVIVTQSHCQSKRIVPATYPNLRVGRYPICLSVLTDPGLSTPTLVPYQGLMLCVFHQPPNIGSITVLFSGNFRSWLIEAGQTTVGKSFFKAINASLKITLRRGQVDVSSACNLSPESQQ